ncbi:MAG: c-type cytochrome [Rhizomicrobium sp.]|jgi:cytochrome c
MRFPAIILAATVLLASGHTLAAGNAAKGAEVFQRCALCHNADKGGGNGLGPNLFGVAGRKAASLPNFAYSSALKNSRIVWTDNKLKAWVSGPARLVSGTRMTFAGLSDKRQIDDLVAYLHTRK